MKTLFPKAKEKGLTLIELLVVVAVVVVLAAMLLPALTDRDHKGSTRVRCMSNQKQIAIGFVMWNSDNANQFPWQVLSTNGGSMEAASRGYAAGNFQCLSNYLRMASLFICPTDPNRSPASDVFQIRNQNVSYFVAVDAGTNAVNSILVGDRHLENNRKALNPGLFVYATTSKMNWTQELHPYKDSARSRGILSFVDGHVEYVQDKSLNSVFLREGLATNRLDIP